jgi:poly-gamma-glutamate capsule biosynthesis protein CapA/YwtB (metallophosphatase superfamily)
MKEDKNNGTNPSPDPSRAGAKEAAASDDARELLLFLCGDVMLGRGIDQILPRSCDPSLYESYVRDARAYVGLAEDLNGPIGQPVGFDYVWGDALDALDRARPDARIINLETSITVSDDYWPDKGVHYRMHPANVGCLRAAGIDCCTLANNHVLDWGYAGLAETLKTLDEAGVLHAGAGRNAEEAAAPAVLTIPGKGRVLVCAFGSPTSGVPPEWAAKRDRPGVNFLPDLSKRTAARITGQIAARAEPGDVVVAAVHWGGNWGYACPAEQVGFAHRLVDGGVHVVQGHSSHHVKALEVYRGGLILYGCGDFLNDYEGIGGHEAFRPDLSLMYLATVDPIRGALTALRLIPMQMRRFRLTRPRLEDARWMADLLNREGTPFGTAVDLRDDTGMVLRRPERSRPAEGRRDR